MWVTRLLALLLPLGIWLAQLGATPRNGLARQMAGGLVVILFSTLAFITIGFGLLFGGLGAIYQQPELAGLNTTLSIPAGGQSWALFGLSGFGIASLSTPLNLQLWLTYLPLALTGAVLVTGMLSRSLYIPSPPHPNPVLATVLLVLAGVLVSGVLLPVASFWLMGGGWLAALGANLNLGHGAVDVGGIGTAALVSGGAGLAWLISNTNPVNPVNPVQSSPELPRSHNPWVIRLGTVCIFVGAAFTSVVNPFNFSIDDPSWSAALTNLVAAAGLAVIFAAAYTYLAEGRPNSNLVARALLGAVIVTSPAGALLPVWTAGLLGLCVGLLVTLGLYATNELLGWSDDAGIVTSVLVPGLLGMVAVGLFGNGTLGQGLNGVGSGSYLGVDGLGVVGLFGAAGAPGDAGQLTAQMVAAVALPGFAFTSFLPLAWLLRRGSTRSLTLPVRQKTKLEPTLPPTVPKPELAPLVPGNLLAHIHGIEFEARSPLPYVNKELPSREVMVDEGIEVGAEIETPHTVGHLNRETLLERLRRARGIRTEQEPPVKTRRGATPFRIAGRRLSVRPITKVEGQSQAGSGKPAR